MRNLGTFVDNILLQDEVSIFYLVEIHRPQVTFSDNTVLPAVDIYDTTHYTDLDFNGNTYVSSSGLLVVDAPRLSQAVDRSPYKITYIDPTFEKRSLFESGLTGAYVVVRIGFLNTTQSPVDGYLVGEPILSVDKTVIVYSGTVDTQGYSITPQEGTVIAVIENSSPMAALDLSRPFYTSREFLRKLSPDDSAFDQVYLGSQAISLRWGRA